MGFHPNIFDFLLPVLAVRPILGLRKKQDQY